MVAETVETLGGVLRTAVVAGCVPETIHRARRLGYFASALAVLRIAREVHKDDPAAALDLALRLATKPRDR